VRGELEDGAWTANATTGKSRTGQKPLSRASGGRAGHFAMADAREVVRKLGGAMRDERVGASVVIGIEFWTRPMQILLSSKNTGCGRGCSSSVPDVVVRKSGGAHPETRSVEPNPFRGV
jgi:hypothetical protein